VGLLLPGAYIGWVGVVDLYVPHSKVTSVYFRFTTGVLSHEADSVASIGHLALFSSHSVHCT
jgi:hypothetical protein